MTDTNTERTPAWWRSWLTPQTFVLFIGIALTIGGAWRDKTYMEERLRALELRVAAERVTSDLIYMRRDVLTEQLRQIQEEQLRLRDQVQGLRRDLR